MVSWESESCNQNMILNKIVTADSEDNIIKLFAYQKCIRGVEIDKIATLFFLIILFVVLLFMYVSVHMYMYIHV